MTDEQPTVSIDIDHPIKDASRDTLQRAQLAESFARRVLALPATQGLVVGIFGQWGSGKSSFINLARATFNESKVPVLDFNPWMFSDTEQLVERFFDELSSQLRLQNQQQLGEALEEYADALSGRLGAGLKIAGIWVRRRSRGLSGHREKIEQSLANRKKPIIVVLDDVDRLSGPETRNIFKLVRLTANFPNLIYVVACDRNRVEKALDDDGVDGSDYLGKIIQLPFDLPEVPRQLLKDQTLESIHAALHSIPDPGPVPEHEWRSIYEDVIRPLLRNIRDLRRYCVTVHGTAYSLRGAVARADMLALEAIRLFLPDVFRKLPAAIYDLTASPGASQVGKDFEAGFHASRDRSDTDPPPAKSRIEAMIKKAGPQEHIVRDLIRHLFPQGAQYLSGASGDRSFNTETILQQRRAGHELVLQLYLERVADQDLLDSHDAEQAYARMADRHALDKFLRSRDPTRLQNVIHHLLHYENEFQPQHAQPSTIALLNLLPDLPREAIPLLDDPQKLIGSIVVRLLRTLEKETAREQALKSILPELTSLSAKVTLIDRIGHRPKLGYKLVSKIEAAQYEEVLSTEIQASPPDALAEERNLVLVLSFARQRALESDQSFTLPNSPRLTFALLQDCQTVHSGPTLDSPTRPRQSFGLSWEKLSKLHGTDARLQQQISDLASHFDELRPWLAARMNSIEDAETLFQRANKHLSQLREQ